MTKLMNAGLSKCTALLCCNLAAGNSCGSFTEFVYFVATREAAERGGVCGGIFSVAPVP